MWLARDRYAIASSGFTLLEVMVALAILGIGLVTAIELFAGSLRLGTKASHRTQAVLFAQVLMDQLFSRDELDDGEEAGQFPGGYTWVVRIQTVPPDEDEDSGRFEGASGEDFDVLDLKELKVSVSWGDGRRRQAFVLHSLRAIRARSQADSGL